MTEPHNMPYDSQPGLQPDRMEVNGVQYIRSDMVVGEPVGELRARLLEQNVHMAGLEARAAAAEGRVEELQENLKLFRQAVREKAIEVADEQNWCDEGLNAALEELGLDPKNRTYRVEVRLFAYQDVEIEVTASSEDEAQVKAVEDEECINELWREADGSGWEGDSLHVEDPQVRSTTMLR